PTLTEHTYGIPGLAEFNITTFDKQLFEGGKDGVPVTQFMRDFAEFTLVLEYDGLTVQRKFTKQEVQGQIDLFDRQTNPSKNQAPRIVRRPDAPPLKEPPLPFSLPWTNPQGK
ncbi:MAG: hypothetical protein QOH67_4799, partial [Hyphomicrobiales bacterium]|nr:hypothetical protein [Hyphomicrobiales bacterium]